MKQRIVGLALTLGLFLTAGSAHAGVPEVEWLELMPEEDIELLENMPEISHEGNAPAELPEELMTGRVVSGFNEKDIRIAGFIVPLEHKDDQRVTEFFLVPYYGACIHVPPPPPNQIIHVSYPDGIHVDVLYEPYWIQGKLLTNEVSNDVAESSYTMDADDVTLYQ